MHKLVIRNSSKRRETCLATIRIHAIHPLPLASGTLSETQARWQHEPIRWLCGSLCNGSTRSLRAAPEACIELGRKDNFRRTWHPP